MRRANVLAVFLVLLAISCATVKVQAPKEPIKIDVSMRLDVYQHVQKDIDAIEDIVTGTGKSGKPESFLNNLVRNAYAQDLSPEVEEAALRRKARYDELTSLQSNGVVGETNSGLVSVRKNTASSAESLVNNENKDRMIIYRAIAEKNGTAVEAVQEIYAVRLQESAPSGTPIQSASGSWGMK